MDVAGATVEKKAAAKAEPARRPVHFRAWLGLGFLDHDELGAVQIPNHGVIGLASR